MNITIQFYNNEFGDLRARSDELPRYVLDFLEENVRGWIGACDFYINMLESVRDGLEEPGAGGGDAFGYYIDKKNIQLWHLWNGSDEKCTIDIETLLQCLKLWRREIEKANGDHSQGQRTIVP